jgi:hypothetical protein
MPIDELELKCVFLTFYSTKRKPRVLKKLPFHRYMWPYLNLAILFKPICITALKTFYLFDIPIIPDEGYYRNPPYALN